MSKTSFTRKRGQPFKFSEQERARLHAAAQADASDDPDNPPLTEAQLRRMQLAREVRKVREATGLSQIQFAERFRIGLGRLRDFEQARSEPDLPLRMIFRLIFEDPERAKALIARIEQQDEATYASH
jgi:putative transcriptional regulator